MNVKKVMIVTMFVAISAVCAGGSVFALNVESDTTLTANVNEDVVIITDNVTLDGGGYTITGTVFLGWWADTTNGVTVKNAAVKGALVLERGENCNIENVTFTENGVKFANNSTGNTVSGCMFIGDGNNTWQVTTDGADFIVDFNLVEDNDFQNQGATGRVDVISSYTSDDALFFTGNTVNGGWFATGGSTPLLEISGSTLVNVNYFGVGGTNVNFTDNDISGAPANSGGYYVFYPRSAGTADIKGNTFYGAGIWIAGNGTGEINIEGNVVANAATDGIDVEYGNDRTNVLINHNTVYNCAGDGIRAGKTPPSPNVVNNIVVGCGNGIPGNPVIAYCDAWNNAGLDYNVWGATDAGGNINWDPFNGGIDPVFSSVNQADPDFLYLSCNTPLAILLGASDGLYMGALPVAGGPCDLSDDDAADIMADCAIGAENHGEFVSCVADVANNLIEAGYLQGAGQLVKQAARSSTGKPSTAGPKK